MVSSFRECLSSRNDSIFGDVADLSVKENLRITFERVDGHLKFKGTIFLPVEPEEP